MALQELTSPHGLADAPALLKFHLTALGAGRMGALNEDYGSNVAFPLFLAKKWSSSRYNFAGGKQNLLELTWFLYALKEANKATRPDMFQSYSNWNRQGDLPT